MPSALRPDGAGWQSAGAIAVPADISPILLPPGSPKLDPADRLSRHLRECGAFVKPALVVTPMQHVGAEMQRQRRAARECGGILRQRFTKRSVDPPDGEEGGAVIEIEPRRRIAGRRR